MIDISLKFFELLHELILKKDKIVITTDEKRQRVFGGTNFILKKKELSCENISSGREGGEYSAMNSAWKTKLTNKQFKHKNVRDDRRAPLKAWIKGAPSGYSVRGAPSSESPFQRFV